MRLKIILILFLIILASPSYTQLSIESHFLYQNSKTAGIDIDNWEKFGDINGDIGFGVGIEYQFKKLKPFSFELSLDILDYSTGFSFSKQLLILKEFIPDNFMTIAKSVNTSISIKYTVFKTDKLILNAIGSVTRVDFNGLNADIKFENFRLENFPEVYLASIKPVYFTTETRIYLMGLGLNSKVTLKKKSYLTFNLLYKSSFENFTTIIVNYAFWKQDNSILQQGKTLISNRGDGLYINSGLGFTF